MPEEKSDNGLGLKLLIWTLGIAATVSLGGAIYYLFFQPDLWDSANAPIMGQRGDFFGGFLNPILTTLTFAAFLATVWMQRTELRNSRLQFQASTEEMKEQTETARAQSYQAGFFQLLTMYDNIANSMSITDPVTKKTITGRQAFSTMYSNLRRIYREKCKRFPKADDKRVLLLAFETVFKQEHHQLPHYFRFLYNSIKMIEDGPSAAKYIKILRASISNQELLILFYNCAISPYGKNFRDLAERYALFDNMSPRLLEPSHATLLGEQAFGLGGYEALVAQGRPRMKGDLTDALPPK
jgi:hypothetical protein